ncbi:TIGR02449 family protein [Aestuariirhabdus sp. LZHN29]|uniref:TIGR02449 family protein n=1 Tax=Aestuariirhabdus sp. LZHN29 TaxID=3417462 RepID=UPI003CE98788
MDYSQIDNLSTKVEELIALCDELKQENRLLRSSEHGLREERAVLIEKNELARSKVEAMITRLKALDTET